MKKQIFLLAGLAFFTFKSQAQTVTDYDGNVYNTVIIGTQVWMTENLKVTHFCNGESIPNVTDSTQWSSLSAPAYCNYRNNANNVATYGRLYNWYAVSDKRNLCPAGWHIPTNAELTTLIEYLGGESVAGGKLKSISGWKNPNSIVSNSSNFSGLPSGARAVNGTYYGLGVNGLWWSSTEMNSTQAWDMNLIYVDSHASIYSINKKIGYSIRCIKDTIIGGGEIKSNFDNEKSYKNQATVTQTINVKDHSLYDTIINLKSKIKELNEENKKTEILNENLKDAGFYFQKARRQRHASNILFFSGVLSGTAVMILTQAPIIGLGIYAVTGIISISIHGSSMSKLNKVRRILWMH